MPTVSFTADSIEELAELVRAWRPDPPIHAQAITEATHGSAEVGVRRVVDAMQGEIARRLLKRIALSPGEWVHPTPEFCAEFDVDSAASLGGAIGSINRLSAPVIGRQLVETVVSGAARWRVSASDADAILSELR